MQPKEYYLARKALYHDIVTHPDFDLGRREIAALERFLPIVARHIQGRVNIVHLGIGDGREIGYFARNFSIDTYVVNDISKPDLEAAIEKGKSQFPHLQFREILGDVEDAEVIERMRRNLVGQTIIAMVGNSVIFANRKVDQNVHAAMQADDLFILTLETRHAEMFRSYQIDPVYQLLSRGGLTVHKENTTITYEEGDQCLKVIYEDGRVLLAAYKPTLQELRDRMKHSGFSTVEVIEFQDLNMICGLFRTSRARGRA